MVYSLKRAERAEKLSRFDFERTKTVSSSLSLGNGNLSRSGSCRSLRMLGYIEVAVTDDDRGRALLNFNTDGKRGPNPFVSL